MTKERINALEREIQLNESNLGTWKKAKNDFSKLIVEEKKDFRKKQAFT